MLHPLVEIPELMMFLVGEKVYLPELNEFGTISDLTETGCWIVRLENGKWATVYNSTAIRSVAHIH